MNMNIENLLGNYIYEQAYKELSSDSNDNSESQFDKTRDEIFAKVNGSLERDTSPNNKSSKSDKDRDKNPKTNILAKLLQPEIKAQKEQIQAQQNYQSGMKVLQNQQSRHYFNMMAMKHGLNPMQAAQLSMNALHTGKLEMPTDMTLMKMNYRI